MIADECCVEEGAVEAPSPAKNYVFRPATYAMRFLLQFRGLHNDLRLPEFLSVLAMLRQQPESSLDINLTPTFATLSGTYTPANPKRGPAGSVLYGEIFYFANLKDVSEAEQLAARCVLLRAIYVPCGHGVSYDECVLSIDTEKFAGALEPLRCEKKKPSFRCNVEAFGRKYSIEQQLERIHRFSEVLRPFPGIVRMKNADHQLWILEDAFPVQGHGTPHGQPRQVFFARKMADGQKHVGAQYSLKRRRYIGPTSMDAELSFVMANMAHVKKDDLVNDPFCGTAGILVACAVRGAHVIGGDINILALRGKDHATIVANFAQYGLSAPLGIVRADVLNSPIVERKNGVFDAIVCDPPYGIKEGMKVFREDHIDASLQHNHFQGTQRVRFVDFLAGVLQYAVNTLVVGGRLVYWLPTTNDYTPEDVPNHPALRLVSNCEQPLTSRMSRRLLTMVRLSDKEAGLNQRERDRQAGVQNATARMPAHVDLACKLLRQPERAESRVRARETMLL
ncbi:tRNA methyltransferase 11 [Gracilaria domingensis]|nr:tRNA methyltransferase 11 [Gracilaria domingensis]